MKDRPVCPPDFSWFNVSITVSDMDKAINLYTSVFGFNADQVSKNTKGKTVWAALSYKGVSVMLAPQDMMEGMDFAPKVPSQSHTPSPMSLYLYHEDLQGLHDKALKNGLTVAQPIQDMFWGDRTLTLVDNDGYPWMFAQNIGEFDPSKAPPEWS